MEDPKDLRRLQRKALLLDLTSKLAALLKEDGTEFDGLMELAFTRLDEYEKLNTAFPVSQKKPKAVKSYPSVKKVRGWGGHDDSKWPAIKAQREAARRQK